MLNIDESAGPYVGSQVPFLSTDLVHPGALTNWLEDDQLWVPTTRTVSFKPLLSRRAMAISSTYCGFVKRDFCPAIVIGAG